MKIWTSEYIFNHPWETVTQAVWKKYPNPMNPAVIGTDVIEREIFNGILYTHRIVSSQWNIPKWAQSLLGAEKTCYASERSEVDPKERHMILRTINLTFCRYIAVHETLKYIPDPTDPARTLLKQEASVTVKGVPLTSYIEDLLTKTISLNAGKGRQAMEWVISKLEMNDFATSAVKNTDEILYQTKKSLEEITNNAKKSFDDIQNLTSQSIPKY